MLEEKKPAGHAMQSVGVVAANVLRKVPVGQVKHVAFTVPVDDDQDPDGQGLQLGAWGTLSVEPDSNCFSEVPAGQFWQ